MYDNKQILELFRNISRWSKGNDYAPHKPLVLLLALAKLQLGEERLFLYSDVEGKIKDLLRRGAQVESFGVGTNMGTSIDAPSLDVIYKIRDKMQEIDSDPRFHYKPAKVEVNAPLALIQKY